jgi:integrase
MGIKKQKGTVYIENLKSRIRLRWQYLKKRYSVSHSAYNKVNLVAAKSVGLQIELDMANGQFDDTLVKYGGKAMVVPEEKVYPKSVVEHFEKWVKP